MSELKAINAYQLTINTEDSEVYIHNDEFGCGGYLVECYLKSEADKVIAEMEESHKKEVEQLLIEIVELKKEIEVQKRLRNMALSSVPNALKVMKIIQHHKYKRCLAMARGCRLRARWFGDNAFYKKEQWALQWHKRWLELANKFKDKEAK